MCIYTIGCPAFLFWQLEYFKTIFYKTELNYIFIFFHFQHSVVLAHPPFWLIWYLSAENSSTFVRNGSLTSVFVWVSCSFPFTWKGTLTAQNSAVFFCFILFVCFLQKWFPSSVLRWQIGSSSPWSLNICSTEEMRQPCFPRAAQHHKLFSQSSPLSSLWDPGVGCGTEPCKHT